MGGREARRPPGVKPAGVHVELTCEHDPPVADVDARIRRDRGGAKVADEFTIGGGQEEIALVLVLTEEG